MSLLIIYSWEQVKIKTNNGENIVKKEKKQRWDLDDLMKLKRRQSWMKHAYLSIRIMILHMRVLFSYIKNNKFIGKSCQSVSST